jgi:hypothetical protein
LGAVKKTQIVEACGYIGMVRAEGLLGDIKGLFGERDGFTILPFLI